RRPRASRSRRDAERSLIGHNWHLSFDEYLVPGTWSDQGTTCPAIQWRMGSGFADVWVDQCYASDDKSGWRAFPGFFGKIRALPGGGYQIRNANGTVKTFAQEGLDDNNNTIWMLTRIEDRNGNAMTIHHTQAQRGIDRITDTLGRTITFHYDANYRIDSITDFAGRSVVYTYDAAGNLTSARSPIVTGTPNGNDFPGGKPTTYHYLGEDGCTEEALKHNLKSIIDGKGQTFLTNVYVSQSSALCGNPGTPIDTVASQVYGGGTITYAFTPLPPGEPVTANVITTEATVTDRNGNIQAHRFNTEGNPLWVQYRTNRGVRALGGGDEPDYTETYTYVDNGGGDAPMLVSRRTQSGGFNVDASGNLVSYTAGMSEDIIYYDQLSQNPGADIFQK